MGIVLAFAPFIAFAIVDRLVGPTEGLIAGALVSLALLIRDWVSADRSPKILEIGTTILFGGLALYALFGGPAWSIVGVRLRVDGGLLLIVLISLAVRKPFTLQYAREQVRRTSGSDLSFCALTTSLPRYGRWRFLDWSLQILF